MFCKRVTPFFSCKSKVSNNIVLLTEGNKLINNDLKYAEFLIFFFNCVIKELNSYWP